MGINSDNSLYSTLFNAKFRKAFEDKSVLTNLKVIDFILGRTVVFPSLSLTFMLSMKAREYAKLFVAARKTGLISIFTVLNRNEDES